MSEFRCKNVACEWYDEPKTFGDLPLALRENVICGGCGHPTVSTGEEPLRTRKWSDSMNKAGKIDD